MGITVPVTILLASVIGIVWGLARVRRDRLPLYFLVHLPTLPVLRMLHDPRARRRPALPADVLLPGRLRGLGNVAWRPRALPAWLAFRPRWPASPSRSSC